jgi:drug/metabolite transporter (DMT)-like permease
MTVAAAETPAIGSSAFSPRIWLSFAIVTMIWGSTWLVIKTQLGTVPASWSVTWRFLLAGTVMFLISYARGKSLRLTARGHGFAMLVAIMQFTLNFNFVYRAEAYVASGLVALSFALLVVPNAIMAAMFLGQRITLRFGIGSLIGIVGLALMFGRDVLNPAAAGTATLIGLALAIAGMLSASVANVMQAAPAGRRQPLEAGLAWAMLYGTMANAAVAWFVSGPPVFEFSWGYAAGVAYLGIVASALAFSLYYAMIRDVGPGKAAYTGVVVPLVAMGLSTIFEGYVWTPVAGFGAALAILGLVVALRSRG